MLLPLAGDPYRVRIADLGPQPGGLPLQQVAGGGRQAPHGVVECLARLPHGSPDLSGRSVLDRRFAAFLLSDHPAATFERCRRRAAYLDDAARRREVLHGWLAKLDAIPPRPGEAFDDSVRRLAATTRDLLDQQAARLPAEVGEPDPVRVTRERERHGRYPTRYLGRAAAHQPIPPERPEQRGGGGHER